MSHRRVAITGASGFIGTHLVPFLLNADYEVLPISRAENAKLIVDDPTQPPSCLAKKISDCGTLVHLAGQAHNPRASDTDYFNANVNYSLRIVECAHKANVKRFVFISSIKVNGEVTSGSAFKHSDQPAPKDIYGRTKWAAECALSQYCSEHHIEFITIRPTLVWGKGAKGNLSKLRTLLRWFIPLPFAGIKNKRSILSIKNLVELIKLCIETPNIDGEIFLAADPTPISTTTMIKGIAEEISRPALLIPLPRSLKNMLAKTDRCQGFYNRVFNNLEVDTFHTTDTLKWQPKPTFPISM